ncbi:MAG: tetratricopeptide repeat protein, partial [Candidatus Obscuribacterales bacterium]|nr:tetratricopeptide repeat protein [Candidatus Obscuribacterales bacterium]
MKVDSKDDETICLRATQYLEMGQAQQAIGDFSLAVKICPDSARAYEGRANVYDRLGKSALAQKDRQQAKLLKAAPAELPI